ncbi:hypothetical protein D3C87_1359760 [compost metagenome]
MTDYLRLEPVRQDVVDVMSDEVTRDGADTAFGLEDIARGAVLLLDRKEIFRRTFREQVLESSVECGLVPQGSVRGTALIEDLQGRPVLHRVHQFVGVDILAEPFHSLLSAVALGH